MTPDRWVLHCDCNSFYASVELLEHPELKQKPVAVCGDPEARHGIILAKNEPAKAFGVRTAEPIWQAKRKCPDLVLLPPHRERYRHFSAVINGIYAECTDLVEPFGIDESWLDITHTWHLFASSPTALADLIRRRVRETTGLTISVGASFNKVFAKLGSDYKKPDAMTVIRPEDVARIVWPLPAGDLLYVGRAAGERLARLGIRTIGQLAAADPGILTDNLGKLGAELSRYARGEDEAPVHPVGWREPLKSVGNGMTFRQDLTSPEQVRSALGALAEEVAARLRRHGLWAGAVQVTIRDTDLHTITRQKQLPMSTHLARDLAAECLALVQANWDPARRPVRMLTVTALALTDEPFAVQQSLFGDAPAPDPKREKLENALDGIRRRYGAAAIGAGSRVGNQLGLDGLHMEKNAPAPGEEDWNEKVKGPL